MRFVKNSERAALECMSSSETKVDGEYERGARVKVRMTKSDRKIKKYRIVWWRGGRMIGVGIDAVIAICCCVRRSDFAVLL